MEITFHAEFIFENDHYFVYATFVDGKFSKINVIDKKEHDLT
jgi:hypothetical protein